MHSIRGFALFVDPQRTCRPVGRELRLRCSWNRTLGVPLPKTDLWPGSRHFFLCTWGDRSIGLEAHEMGFSSTLSGKGRRLMQYCHSAYTAILILRNILLHVPLNYEELWSQILSYYLSRRHRSYTFFYFSSPLYTHATHTICIGTIERSMVRRSRLSPFVFFSRSALFSTCRKRQGPRAMIGREKTPSR